MNDEIIEFEDRSYVDPNVGLAENDQFIEKFRNLQAQNQAQINRDTYNLGTPVPSNLGGLTGAEGLWNVRYQRPQVNAAVENLKQTMQQQALNTAMENQLTAAKNRANQAQRTYNRALQEQYAKDRAKANSGTGGTGGNTPDNNGGGGLGVDTTTPSGSGDLVVEQATASFAPNQTAQNAMDKIIYDLTTKGGYDNAGSIGLTYGTPGNYSYVALKRNATGGITGGTVYELIGDQLVPRGDYNTSGITNFLNNVVNSGNRVYDFNGTDWSGKWGLII